MKRPLFLNNHFYHVFNRGVDKRKIFLGNADHKRFLVDMKDFNDTNSSINLYRRVNLGIKIDPKVQDPLVEIVCYCLMPNHFHFILKQLVDGGVSRFMQKLGIGYTNYFNQKYERSGVLFQGKFKAVFIERENYINYLIQYIHLNPLSIIEPDWEEKGIKNWAKTKKFLESYKWSDCRDYNQFEDFLTKKKISPVFGEVTDWVIE